MQHPHEPLRTSPHVIPVHAARRRRGRLLAALGVAVLVGAPAAWAAITGADITNGTITGADLATGTIASVDIGAGAVGTSDLADKERSATREAITADNLSLTALTDVATLELPAGSWHVFGAASLSNLDGANESTVYCHLSTVSGTPTYFAQRREDLTTSGSAGDAAEIDLQTTINLGAATNVALSCVNTGASTDLVIFNRQLLATRVGTRARSGSWYID